MLNPKQEIIILDNESSYQPLIDWYKEVDKKVAWKWFDRYFTQFDIKKRKGESLFSGDDVKQKLFDLMDVPNLDKFLDKVISTYKK